MTTDCKDPTPPSRMKVVGIHKTFPGVKALENVSLEIHPGEVLALVGENGAGKSTLMKVLAGIVRPDSGDIFIDGQRVQFRQPGEAISAGVALIHQELNLHEGLSVAENIFLGREPHRWGWTQRQPMLDAAQRALERVGCGVKSSEMLGNLSVATRQLIEVARAISGGAKLIIMDEPTSSLTNSEAEKLFDVVEGLAREGVSIIYISHRLGEIERLADRVEVLRDGRNVATLTGSQIEHDQMVSSMVGRPTDRLYDRTPQVPGEVRMQVESLVLQGQSTSPISFEVRAGEIVAIAGLMGSGRSELVEAIFGLRPIASGRIVVDGQTLTLGSASHAIRSGIGLVSEDRKQTGLLIESTVAENTVLAALVDSPGSPWLNLAWQHQTSQAMIDRLRVKTASQSTVISNLSGGNQQKIAIAKWLVRQPRVLLLDEPTRGVDVGAKQEIYELLDALSRDGIAIVFVSSEMEEVLALADRVLVMHDGTIRGTLGRHELSDEAIMRFAVGSGTPVAL